MQHVSHIMSPTISDQVKGKPGSFLFLLVYLCATHAVTQQEGFCLSQIPIRVHHYKLLFSSIKKSLEGSAVMFLQEPLKPEGLSTYLI